MESMLRNRRTILAFMAPAVVLFLAFVLYPIGTSLYYGMFSWDLIHKMRFLGVGNYVRMIRDDDVFPVAIRNIFFFMGTSLLIQLIIGYCLAVVLTGGMLFKNALKNIYFLPAVIPSVAVGLLWSFIYSPDIGIVNGFLRAIGLGQFARPWLLQTGSSLWAITLTISWQYTGYAVVIFVAAIQNIPPAIREAARIDGAGAFRMVRFVTIPLTMDVIRVETVLVAIGSLKLFDLVFIMTGGGPVHSTEVLATYIYQRAFRQLEYGYGDALSLVLLGLCLCMTILINRVFRSLRVEY